MLRQKDPAWANDPAWGFGPPRALPIHTLLAWKVTVMRYRIRSFGRHHADIGWTLFACVLAIGLGVVIAYFGA